MEYKITLYKGAIGHPVQIIDSETVQETNYKVNPIVRAKALAEKNGYNFERFYRVILTSDTEREIDFGHYWCFINIKECGDSNL